ncbi:glycosyltransferase family 9 protein [Derxia lacustris]|uniref:glycosyltransferase family 9 protein n=1 Tax=Derxia lacustris TaxID=764842 RepID=UPI00111C62F8|nr:glycosyltransferase family 9 protein [Derxia lacustris]
MQLNYLRRLWAPVCDRDVDGELHAEFRALPWRSRASIVRRLFLRDLAEVLTGHVRWRRARVTQPVRRMLWMYGWTTLGDSVMDLAARDCMPDGVTVDLCLSPGLAPLYAHDPRFGQVFTDPAQCSRGNYDLILVQDYNTRVFVWLRTHYPRVPYAGVIGDLRGECLNRPAFAQGRVNLLFGRSAPIRPPWLAPPAVRIEAEPGDGPRTEIAVALGARDPRRRIADWAVLLPALIAAWPASLPPPRFHLLGLGNARADADTLPDGDWRARHCRDLIDRLDIASTAAVIHGCDAFLGPDGGLMHVALAYDKPGCAVFFKPIEPGWRMVAPHRMHSVTTSAPTAVVAAFLASLAAVDQSATDAPPRASTEYWMRYSPA